MAETTFNFAETNSGTIYTDVIGSLMEYCNEALYPGDERRIFGEALVMVLVNLYAEFNDKAQQRMLQAARGEVLDAIGERMLVTRIAPSPARATFRFTASAVRTQNIIIPAGTRITTDGSVYFETTEAAVLPAGDSHIDIEGVCTTGGSAYNGYAAGTISTLVDLIPYIASAQNITASMGGDDGEPYTTDGDDRLRERIRLAPAALSTAGSEAGYRYFVLSADPDIIDVAIECPEDEPNTVNLYPLMKGGALPDEDTLAKVAEATSGDRVRPMTDLVQVFAPQAVEYEVELKYYCTQADEVAVISAIEAAGGAVDQYNAWQTAELARDINPDQLRRFVLAPTTGTGALRVDVIKPTFVELSKSQVAKLSGLVTISHEVVAG